MRTRTLFSLTRLITTTTTSTTSAAASLPRFSLLRTLSCVRVSPAPVLASSSRFFSTRQAQRSLNDNSPNWSNRPPKETILLDGCDFEHWLVVTKAPPPDWTRDQIIDSYIKTLANVVGSEDEARMKIYSVSTKCYFAFGALVSEELSYKLKELPNVNWVLPDSYLDVRNKDYGGEPFIDGQAVPYDPKYHEEWIRNNTKANIRNKNTENRPRSNRTRNFDRGQGSQDFRNNPNPAPMGGMPNQTASAPNNAGYRQNTPPNNNAGYRQYPPPNPAAGHGHGQNMPHSNAGFAHNMPPSNAGYSQNMPPANTGRGSPNVGYSQNMPQGSPGFAHNMAPQSTGGGARNTGYGMPQRNPGFGNVAGAAPNYSGQGNPGYQNNSYQPTQMGGQQNYGNMGGNPGGGFQSQDHPGRDTPQC